MHTTAAWRYNPDIHGEAKRCVPYQLQRLFARLQLSRASVAATRDLTRSFGFDSMDGFRQQDVMVRGVMAVVACGLFVVSCGRSSRGGPFVQECMAVFIEFLANIGVGTPLGDHVTTEQTGEMEAYLSFTADGQEYCHARDESFRAVTVAVNGMPTIEAALAAYVDAHRWLSFASSVAYRATGPISCLVQAHLPDRNQRLLRR